MRKFPALTLEQSKAIQRTVAERVEWPTSYMTTTNDRQRWSWWFWGCVLYTSSIRVSHQTVAVIKPNHLHGHVMIIMFINSLCHVFYHVHSCSCHVYIISSSWALNTLTFAEFLFLQVSRPTRFRPRMCFVRGSQPKSTRIWKGGISAWPELTAKQPRSFFIQNEKDGLEKHIGTHFVKRVWMKMLVWLVSGRVNEIMVLFVFF